MSHWRSPAIAWWSSPTGSWPAAGEGQAEGRGPDAAADDSPLVLSRSKDEAGGGARCLGAMAGHTPTPAHSEPVEG